MKHLVHIVVIVAACITFNSYSAEKSYNSEKKLLTKPSSSPLPSANTYSLTTGEIIEENENGEIKITKKKASKHFFITALCSLY